MRPHAKNNDALCVLFYAVDKAMLQVDPAGICARQISDKFFKGRLKGVGLQSRHEPPHLVLKIALKDSFRILFRLARETYFVHLKAPSANRKRGIHPMEF